MNPSICIACVGNELARDDGVGMRIGRVLREVPLPAGTTVRFFPQVDLDLIDDLLTAKRFVLCDATRTGQIPGTVTVSTWQDLVKFSNQLHCCHGIGLPDLVMIAAELEPINSRWDVHLVGVEAQTVDEFGTHLSDAVQEALPQALRCILNLIAASPELISLAQNAARILPAPSVLRAFGG